MSKENGSYVPQDQLDRVRKGLEDKINQLKNSQVDQFQVWFKEQNKIETLLREFILTNIYTLKTQKENRNYSDQVLSIINNALYRLELLIKKLDGEKSSELTECNHEYILYSNAFQLLRLVCKHCQDVREISEESRQILKNIIDKEIEDRFEKIKKNLIMIDKKELKEDFEFLLMKAESYIKKGYGILDFYFNSRLKKYMR